MSDNLAYQEERREELIGGEVVMMAPASTDHTFVSGNIYYLFAHYLRGKNALPLPAALPHTLTENRKPPQVLVALGAASETYRGRPDNIHLNNDIITPVPGQMQPFLRGQDLLWLKKEAPTPLRVDLYIRVSGQEQAIKDLSLETQQENLEEYAKERG